MLTELLLWLPLLVLNFKTYGPSTPPSAWNAEDSVEKDSSLLEELLYI